MPDSSWSNLLPTFMENIQQASKGEYVFGEPEFLLHSLAVLPIFKLQLKMMFSRTFQTNFHGEYGYGELTPVAYLLFHAVDQYKLVLLEKLSPTQFEFLMNHPEFEHSLEKVIELYMNRSAEKGTTSK